MSPGNGARRIWKQNATEAGTQDGSANVGDCYFHKSKVEMKTKLESKLLVKEYECYGSRYHISIAKSKPL